MHIWLRFWDGLDIWMAVIGKKPRRRFIHEDCSRYHICSVNPNFHAWKRVNFPWTFDLKAALNNDLTISISSSSFHENAIWSTIKTKLIKDEFLIWNYWREFCFNCWKSQLGIPAHGNCPYFTRYSRPWMDLLNRHTYSGWTMSPVQFVACCIFIGPQIFHLPLKRIQQLMKYEVEVIHFFSTYIFQMLIGFIQWLFHCHVRQHYLEKQLVHSSLKDLKVFCTKFSLHLNFGTQMQYTKFPLCIDMKFTNKLRQRNLSEPVALGRHWMRSQAIQIQERLIRQVLYSIKSWKVCSFEICSWGVNFLAN